MNTIIIQNTLEKFMQSSLDMQLKDTMIIDIVINNNLFSAFYKHKPEYCVFSYSHINEEILQFCNDHANDTKIFIYYNSISDTAQVPLCMTLGHNNNYHIEIPNNILNGRVLDKNLQEHIPNKQLSIVYYAEYKSISKDVLELLYPTTNLPIKIFDAPTFHHYQNLGLLSEADRIDLLYSHKYYLYTPSNNSYMSESIVAGCIPVSVSDILDNSYNAKEPSKPTDYTTYAEFFTNKVLV